MCSSIPCTPTTYHLIYTNPCSIHWPYQGGCGKVSAFEEPPACGGDHGARSYNSDRALQVGPYGGLCELRGARTSSVSTAFPGALPFAWNTPSPPVFRVPPAPPLSLSLVHFPWAHVSFIPGLASSAYAADV